MFRKILIFAVLEFLLVSNTQIFTEENTTLRLISDKMEDFYELNHRYPADWIELKFRPFCFNENRMPNLPNRSQKYVFKPLGCRYTYHMKSNGAKRYCIERYKNGKIFDSVCEKSRIMVQHY